MRTQQICLKTCLFPRQLEGKVLLQKSTWKLTADLGVREQHNLCFCLETVQIDIEPVYTYKANTSGFDEGQKLVYSIDKKN